MKKDGQFRFEGRIAEMYAHIVAQRKQRIRRVVAMSMASVLVLLIVMQGLETRGFSVENTPCCGLEEHIHTEECMQMVLSCGEEERAPTYQLTCPVEVHHHTEECYDSDHELICGLAESVVHKHDSFCYDAAGDLVCTLAVQEEHYHGVSCFGDVKTLVCNQKESKGHTHTIECYTAAPGALKCGLEENKGHAHTDACYTQGSFRIICGLDEGETHQHTDECYGFVRDSLTCGLDEQTVHTHTDSCVKKTLTCTKAEDETHTHSAECYKEEYTCGVAKDETTHHHKDVCYSYRRELTCGKAESAEAHIHSDKCFTQGEKTLTCTIPEGDSTHVHTLDCYDRDALTLTCAEKESAGHTHTDACYKKVLKAICGLNELHIHTDACYPDGDRTKAPACGELELTEHIHDESCVETVDPGHSHDALCYEPACVCGLEEHVHHSGCYIAKDAPAVKVQASSGVSLMNADDADENTDEPEPAQIDTSFGGLALDDQLGGFPVDDGSQVLDGQLGGFLIDDGSETLGDLPESGTSIEVGPDVPVDGGLGIEMAPAAAAPSFAAGAPALQYLPGPGEDSISDGDKGNAKPAESYLTGLTIKKNGYDTTQVNDGDEIQLGMTFNIAQGVLTGPGNQTVVYQLPQEVTITNPNGMSGYITCAGQSAGVYYIGSDGRIYMKFYDSFLQSTSNGILANIGFRALADINDNVEQQVVNFPGSGTSLTVNGNGVYHDLGVQKTASQLHDDGTVDYTVVVSSNVGTYDTINITDVLNNWNADATYDQSSLNITKGGQPVSGYSVNYSTANGRQPQMSINNLPGLAGGESYTITYRVNNVALREGQTQGGVNNSVTAESGSLRDNKTTQTTLEDRTPGTPNYSKRSDVDYYNNKIKWTVRIESNGADLNGYQVTDDMLTAGSTATLTRENPWEQTQITMPYTFGPTTGNVVYEITYSTDIPNVGPYDSNVPVTNTVTINGTPVEHTAYVNGNPPGVDKTGATNGDVIVWTVKVWRNGADFSDASLTDVMDGTQLDGATKVYLNGNEYSFPFYFNSVPQQDYYEFTYTTPAPQADVGDVQMVNNKVILTDDGHETTDEEPVSIVGPGIVKTGYWNQNNGTIQWEIRVHRGSADFSGATLRDEHAPEGTWAEVWIAADNANRYVQFPVDLGSLPAQEDYVFKFSEPAPAPGPGNSVDVTNEAVLRYRDVDYPDDDTVTVTEREETLEKQLNNYIEVKHQNDETDPYVRPLWDINGSPSDAPLTSFTIEDEMFDPEGHPDIHYALGDDIRYSLNIRLTIPGQGDHYLMRCDESNNWSPQYGDATNYVNYQIAFYDAAGNVVADSFEALAGNTAHIKRFALTLTPKDGQESFRLDNVYIQYHSRCYIEGLEKDWSYENTVTMNDKSASAYYRPGEETGERTVTKLIKENGNWNGQWREHWTEEPANVIDATNQTDGPYLDYRLVISYTSADNGPISLTDTLPEGMEFVEGSVTIGYLNTDINLYEKWPRPSDPPDPKLSFSTDYDPLNRQIYFTINGGYNPSGGNTDWLCIEYKTKLVDWTNPFAAYLPFSNTAEWTDAGVSDSVTVTMKNDSPGGRADKTGSVNWTSAGVGVVDYTVILNPKAADIDPDSDRATVTDTLKIANTDGNNYNLSDIRVSLITQNTKLYEYDPTAPDGKGRELSKARYSLRYDDATRTLTVVFPDELACLLEYSYNINRSQFSYPFKMENTVDFGSRRGTSSTEYFSSEESFATVTRSDLTINKVDSMNNAVMLPGAQFRIQYRDMTANEWRNLVMDDSADAQNGLYTTDANGQITVSVRGDAALSREDLLISITEVSPPSGYTWPEGEYDPATGEGVTRYAILANSGSSFDAILARAGMKQKIIDALGLSNGVSDSELKSHIIFVDDALNTTFENKSTVVEVEKLWLDHENHVIANPPAVQVQLMSSPKQKEPGIDLVVHLGRYEYDNSLSFKETVYKDVKIGEPATFVLDSEDGKEFSYEYGTQTGTFMRTAYNVPGTFTVTINGDATDIYVFVSDGSQYKEATITDASYQKAGYSSGGEATEYGTPVTLDASNNWTYCWENLPVGYYSVQEYFSDPMIAEKYTTTYSANNHVGIESGKIIITNKQTPPPPSEDVVMLPETGGIGTVWFTLGGGVLMAAALVILVLLRKRSQHPDE